LCCDPNFLCGSRTTRNPQSGPDYWKRHPRPADVLLLVEVAETSYAYDRDVKLPRYAREHVSEVWIFDLARGAVEVYREPGRPERPENVSGISRLSRIELSTASQTTTRLRASSPVTSARRSRNATTVAAI